MICSNLLKIGSRKALLKKEPSSLTSATKSPLKGLKTSSMNTKSLLILQIAKPLKLMKRDEIQLRRMKYLTILGRQRGTE